VRTARRFEVSKGLGNDLAEIAKDVSFEPGMYLQLFSWPRKLYNSRYIKHLGAVVLLGWPRIGTENAHLGKEAGIQIPIGLVRAGVPRKTCG
jgi:hypothetical protein